MVKRKQIFALGLLLATGIIGATEPKAVITPMPKVAIAKVRALPAKIHTQYGIRPEHVEGLTNAFVLIGEGMEIQALRDEERGRLYNDFYDRFNPYFSPKGYDVEIFMNSMRRFPEIIQGRYGIRPEHVEGLTNAFRLILDSMEIQVLRDEEKEALCREVFFPFKAYFFSSRK